MWGSGATPLIVYCADYKCAHSVVVDAGRWSDDVRLSDLEPRFTCQACGHRGADIGRSLSINAWGPVKPRQRPRNKIA
jgi:hypothetical protein